MQRQHCPPGGSGRDAQRAWRHVAIRRLEMSTWVELALTAAQRALSEHAEAHGLAGSLFYKATPLSPVTHGL